MSVLSNDQLMMTDDGYNIERSLRFRSSASAYLNRTPASNGNGQTWTLSMWVKRGALTSAIYQLFNARALGTSSPYTMIDFETSNKLIFYTQGSTLLTTQVFRDVSSWYHFVFVMDTTQATAANRCRIYVNGSQITAFDTATYPTQNFTSSGNQNILHLIGAGSNGAGAYTQWFDGYVAETVMVDGQALTPSSFGQTDAVTGVWQPIKYTGTYGTNGFYLPFTDNTSPTTLAYDKSGNGNNWTANNISTTAGATYDSMTDVPTLTSATAANYCVLNPLVPTSLYNGVMSNGNLTATLTATTQVNCHSTLPIPQTGKWYTEVQVVNSATFGIAIGIEKEPFVAATGIFGSSGIAYYNANGNKYVAGSASAYGTAWATGTNTIGMAVDSNAGTITFYLNNVSQGSISITTGIDWYFAGTHGSGSGSHTENWNFGQRPFAYTPPTGFKALNTFNLPDPVIKKPNQYMDATLWTGNGAARSITNSAGFAPDLVWIKSRNYNFSHYLFDKTRGVLQSLYSNLTNAETTESGSLTAFNSNGFSLGTNGAVNDSTIPTNFVGWQWKESATSGFDIVTYTGNGTSQNISHSLGVQPSMLIVKQRTAASTTSWGVWFKGITSGGEYLFLNATGAKASSSTIWNNTAPTSSVFSVGNDGTTNTNSGTYIAYLFAEIAGFSKFGSYTGNGSADGPFVYCGFRPKYVMFKRTDSADNWNILDTSRDTYNLSTLNVQANLANAENSSPTDRLDFLSNGFKQRGTGGGGNASGGTYIYAAFAESPFKTSNAR